MGFLTSNRSSQPMDRALHRIKTGLKKCNPSNPTSVAFCKSEIEDIDLEMQLKLTEGMSDESNCTWLSSDCDSSSLISTDISGDLCQLNGWNQSFIDSLPFIKSGNPDSTVHDLQIDLCGEPLKEEGVLNDQSVSSYDEFRQCSCTSLSTMDDFDRTAAWISTFDLNHESSDLIQLKGGVNFTYSDFPSPSYSYRANPQCESSLSSSSSLISFHLTEASSSLSSEFDHDEPLFWPFNQNLYESSELGKSFLSVSPRKNKKMVINKVVNDLKSVEVKLNKRKDLSASTKSMQLQSGRKTELNQTTKKSATGWKSMTCTNYNNTIRSPLQSSRLLAQASAKIVPSNTSTKKRINSMKEAPQLKSKNQRNKVEELPKKILEFEASFFDEVFMEGASIEKLVGLNEFDGHEWLNFNFTGDCFIQSI